MPESSACVLPFVLLVLPRPSGGTRERARPGGVVTEERDTPGDRRRFLEAGRRQAGLEVSVLWLDYLRLGGNADQIEVEGHLVGLLQLPVHEQDVLAHAVNERLREQDLDPSVPYAAAPRADVLRDLAAVLAQRGPDGAAANGLGTTPPPRTAGTGEHLLGELVDRSHLLPARLVVPLVVRCVTAFGGSDVVVYLQDYEQAVLLPVGGDGADGPGAVPIEASLAGRAFMADEPVEHRTADGDVRLFLPMLDGTARVGVLAFSLPEVDDDARRTSRRLAGLVADLIVTKGSYTDLFFNARRSRSMTLSAQLQWQLLPPLTMTTPRVALAGALEPAYDVGGDSFDYAYNDDVLHLAIIDAMGHGLDAATMATVAVAAYRHARRDGVDLVDLYGRMDAATVQQFGAERFVTAQMGELDTGRGLLTWVNAGHPAPLLLRGRRVVAELTAPTTLPVGLGGPTPVVQSVQLEPGDRVLLFTDGVIEERLPDGVQFGETRLRDLVERAGAEGGSVQETVRRLSRALMRGRGGRTSDDATLLLVEWTGPGGEEELTALSSPLPAP